MACLGACYCDGYSPASASMERASAPESSEDLSQLGLVSWLPLGVAIASAIGGVLGCVYPPATDRFMGDKERAGRQKGQIKRATCANKHCRRQRSWPKQEGKIARSAEQR